MKKSLWIVICLILLICVLFVKYIPYVKENNVLKIGEEKYLEFLWIVDGAFNDDRYNETFKVNGNSLDNDKLFKCIYSKNSNTCKGENFEEAFSNLFKMGFSYDDVYGDKVSFEWYEKIDDYYYFTNINSCNSGRMSIEHNLVIKKIESNRLTYQVTFNDDKSKRIYDKLFVLEKEKDKWKVSKAYYHDPCYMDYNIG